MLRDWIFSAMHLKRWRRMKSVCVQTAHVHWVLRNLPLILKSAWEWAETVHDWQTRSQYMSYSILVVYPVYSHTLKRQKTPTNESEHEPSDDNEDDWSYHTEKAGKKLKKDRVVISSPRRGATSRGPGRPSKQVREHDEMASLAQINLTKVREGSISISYH